MVWLLQCHCAVSWLLNELWKEAKVLPALDGLICELDLVGAAVLVVGIVVVVEVGETWTGRTGNLVLISFTMWADGWLVT